MPQHAACVAVLAKDGHDTVQRCVKLQWISRHTVLVLGTQSSKPSASQLLSAAADISGLPQPFGRTPVSYLQSFLEAHGFSDCACLASQLAISWHRPLHDNALALI
jgi:hypothetical protein